MDACARCSLPCLPQRLRSLNGRTVLCLCLLQVRTLLQYIANQLKNDNAYDLLVLSEIISKMVRLFVAH